jgi:hypothetical protein
VTDKQPATQETQSTPCDATSCMEMMEEMMGEKGCDCSEMMSQMTAMSCGAQSKAEKTPVS